MGQRLEKEIQTSRTKMRGYRLNSQLISAIAKAARELDCTETDVVRAALRAHLAPYFNGRSRRIAA